MDIFPSIFNVFQLFFDESRSRQIFYLQHAYDLNPVEVASLKSCLESFFGYKTVVFVFKKTPSILAGFRVYNNRFLIDLSLLSRLNKVERTLQGLNG